MAIRQLTYGAFRTLSCHIRVPHPRLMADFDRSKLTTYLAAPRLDPSSHHLLCQTSSWTSSFSSCFVSHLSSPRLNHRPPPISDRPRRRYLLKRRLPRQCILADFRGHQNHQSHHQIRLSLHCHHRVALLSYLTSVSWP